MSLRTEFKSHEIAANTAAVIELENVSVRYRVPQERIESLKEYAIRLVQGRLGFEHLWALKDISLTIHPGEVFGIIGPNGAGKSTLLKVIAKVLRPIEGRVVVRGRIAPLLELGAGFNSELTGRENIYLNGTILGYSRRDLEARFDRIVAFAGLEEFVNAPLRTYSSGMVARLGFAVATDVRPEILIVDEILGVGDAAFQKKSFERIQDFQSQGTTILLVSHSLDQVREMCSRAIWLDRGRIVFEGSAQSTVNEYLVFDTEQESERLTSERRDIDFRRRGNRKIEIHKVELENAEGREQKVFETGDTVILRMYYRANQPVQEPIFGVAIHRQDGAHITGPNTQFSGEIIPRVEGEGMVEYRIPSLPLLEGLYYFSVAATNRSDTEMFDYHDRAYAFRVLNNPEKMKERYGLIAVGGEWKHTQFDYVNAPSSAQ